MENTNYSDELQHHGTKGMKWGRRLYQNKDGSLTPLGQKRYNKEVDRLKKETEKVKAAEKLAANQKKVQKKFDKLDAKKQKLEERKKALKGKDADGKKPKEETGETLEQRRERLLKSTDPKELYKGKDDLSYQEITDRINRIDLEAKLQSRIPKEENKTAVEYMESIRSKVDSATNLYKSVDNAYSTFANSTIAKAIGLDLPTGKQKEKGFNPVEFIKKVRNNEATAQEIEVGSKALKNLDTIEQDANRRENKAKADADFAAKRAEAAREAKAAEAREKAAREAVEKYNKRWEKDGADDRVTKTSWQDGEYSKKGQDIADNIFRSKPLLLPGPKNNPTDSKSPNKPKSPDDGGKTELIDKQDYANKAFQKDIERAKSMAKSGRYSQEEIANKLGISESSVSKYAGGEKPNRRQDIVIDVEPHELKYVDTPSNVSKGKSSLQKTADNLAKAAEKSSAEVRKVESIGDDYIQQMLKRNDDLLNGRK